MTNAERTILLNQETIMGALLVLMQEASGSMGSGYHGERLRERIRATDEIIRTKK